MAKYRSSSKGYESGKEITTKSWFGSHAEMVVELEEGQQVVLFARTIEDYETVCKDDRGYYVTTTSRLDDGLADPNRYGPQRLDHDQLSV